MFILIGARVFGLTFYGVNGNVWIEDLLLGLPGGEYGFLLVVSVIIFILGCFLDFFEIAFILVPLLAPVAEKLGIDLIWFGIILGINLQASFLTPPFGFALFYLRSIAPSAEWFDKVSGRHLPAVKTMEIYRGAVPFIAIQVLMIAIVIAFPTMVTHYKNDEPNVNPADIKIELPARQRRDPGDRISGRAAAEAAARRPAPTSARAAMPPRPAPTSEPANRRAAGPEFRNRRRTATAGAQFRRLPGAIEKGPGTPGPFVIGVSERLRRSTAPRRAAWRP